MNKADLIFRDNLKEILENGTSTYGHEVRPKWGDGTPAHTIYINQVVEKYNIDKGEFPISTFRPVAWKSAIKEILVIFQDQLNTREAFESRGIRWWESWMNKQGNIGRSYPYNLESHRDWEQWRNLVEVKKRIKIKEENNNNYPDNFPLFKIERLYNESEIYKDHYIILEEYKKEKKYKVQNILTGEIGTCSRNGLFNAKVNYFNHFKYDKIYYGMGYIGNLDNVFNFEKWEINILKRKWVAMLKRVNTYKQYNNIFIDQRWHSFENFLQDIRYLPQYHIAKENKYIGWELDKDYYGSNCYSKDTCVFLKHSENSIYANKPQLCYLIKPNGEKELFLTIAEACKKYDINYSNLYSTIDGTRNHANGYKIELITDLKNDYVYRYEISRNQINNILYGLKNYPYERRHITSFWNWQNIDKKQLVECAYETVWNVRGEYLDMTLHQRSSDYCTAGCINKLQYVALMMMVAKHVGLKPGTFMHIVENLHVYDRHIDNAKILLERKSSEKTPKLILNTDKTDFYSFTIDDFELIDFESAGEQLKFELAI